MSRTETATKPAADSKGTAWLTEVVNKNLGTSYTSYQIRILIRKLVKAGTIERGEGRYEFTGLKDPRVVAIVKAAKAGGVKEATAEKVDGAKTSARRSRAKAAPEPEVEDDDVEEEEEPAKPARRTRAKTPTAATRRARAKAAAAPEPEATDDDDDLDLDEL